MPVGSSYHYVSTACNKMAREETGHPIHVLTWFLTALAAFYAVCDPMPLPAR